MKSKTVAGILAILVGTFGVHKFYLGKVKAGILYLLFSWTAIPGLVGLVEGILYLVNSEEQFNLKYNPQLAIGPSSTNPALKKLDIAKVKEELALLAEWKERGIITEEDFQRRSRQIVEGRSNFE